LRVERDTRGALGVDSEEVTDALPDAGGLHGVFLVCGVFASSRGGQLLELSDHVVCGLGVRRFKGDDELATTSLAGCSNALFGIGCSRCPCTHFTHASTTKLPRHQLSIPTRIKSHSRTRPFALQFFEESQSLSGICISHHEYNNKFLTQHLAATRDGSQVFPII
jgi:hypothetical protein